MSCRWACFKHDEGCCGYFNCLVGSSLVLHIFARLELRDLIRVRCVCKSWYDAVLSPQFLKIWKNEEERIWAVLAIRSERKESQKKYGKQLWYPVSASSENRREIWYVSSFLSPLETERIPCMLPVPRLPNGTKFEGLLSSHGLVLGRLMDFDKDSKHAIKLVVGNPITNSWKHLPLAPVPPTISPHGYHQFFMERDPVSENYIIVIFLYSQDRIEEDEDEEMEDEDWMYNVLQYESRLGTWCRGPTLYECNINHKAMLQGSMVGTELMVNDLPMFSVYDPCIMAWSHLHISLSFEFPPEDDEGWRGSCSAVLVGFKYRGKYFVATSSMRLEGGPEDLGLGVWQLDQENGSSKLVSKKRFKDLYGAGWWNDVIDMRWKCQNVGDYAIFSTSYKPHTHGLTPPVAFNMHDFTWISVLTEEEKRRNANFSPIIDYECAYAFIPSLAARV